MKDKPVKSGTALRLPGKAGRTLPPLDYLPAFEAAALTESFAAAGKQLNVSETAISRKVRLLELHFGQTFFDRGHRSISLNAHGQAFLARIVPALDAIRQAAEDTLQSVADAPITIAATHSVAALWLAPRLSAFRKANPGIKIMLVASDNDAECLADTIDVTILRGEGSWPGYEAELLFGETIFPVCSPGFLQANPGVATLDGLTRAPLIEVASAHTEWMNWHTWLGHNAAGGGALRRVNFFNTYPLSIAAAVEGAGLALGWGHLVDQYLESGLLVRPLGPLQVRTQSGYFLLLPERRKPSAGRDALIGWLRELSAARRRYGAAQP